MFARTSPFLAVMVSIICIGMLLSAVLLSWVYIRLRHSGRFEFLCNTDSVNHGNFQAIQSCASIHASILIDTTRFLIFDLSNSLGRPFLHDLVWIGDLDASGSTLALLTHRRVLQIERVDFIERLCAARPTLRNHGTMPAWPSAGSRSCLHVFLALVLQQFVDRMALEA